MFNRYKYYQKAMLSINLKLSVLVIYNLNHNITFQEEHKEVIPN
jgi:hypothetical protein